MDSRHHREKSKIMNLFCAIIYSFGLMFLCLSLIYMVIDIFTDDSEKNNDKENNTEDNEYTL